MTNGNKTNILTRTPIFLFSLPRSGSTLCQRILGMHKEIATVAEPHLLLHYLYSLNEQGVYARYDNENAVSWIKVFFESLPNKHDDYFEELHDFIIRLYSKSINKESIYYLDKTPIYNLIAEEILTIFPNAKYIFLWRNPIAVLSSINETFHRGSWGIYLWENQLYQGLENLHNVYQSNAHKSISINYEDMVSDPIKVFRNVFGYLDLSFDPTLLSNFANEEYGRLGDPNYLLEENKRIHSKSLEKWKHTLNNPLRNLWCRRYLKWIGPERLNDMGYDFEKIYFDLKNQNLRLQRAGSDILKMSYGELNKLFELNIFRQKVKDLRNGQRIYAHKFK